MISISKVDIKQNTTFIQPLVIVVGRQIRFRGAGLICDRRRLFRSLASRPVNLERLDRVRLRRDHSFMFVE